MSSPSQSVFYYEIILFLEPDYKISGDSENAKKESKFCASSFWPRQKYHMASRNIHIPHSFDRLTYVAESENSEKTINELL